ncbi:MAG: hypothetical protein HY042_03255, partial [Spirochaetia bacterium]|nr:hypothetical protein [Spirochaetia bacterium]
MVPGQGTWRTLETPHFAIHYDGHYRDAVVRSAAVFEKVYEKLEPRYKSGVGVTHVAMVFNWDVVQSFALPWGFDQVVLYVDAPRAGQFSQYDSWIELLFTHEYTHILTLRYYDTPFLTFLRLLIGAPPNLLSPRGLSEGIAVYEESRSTGKGRLNDPLSRMVFRSWVLANDFPESGEALSGSHQWPLGSMVYLFGGRIWKHVGEKVGEQATADYWHTNRIPIAITWRFFDIQAGSFGRIYREMREKETLEFQKEIDEIKKAGVTPARRITKDGYQKDFLVRTEQGELLFWAYPPDKPAGIYRLSADGIDRVRMVDECSGITSSGGLSIASENYQMVPGDGYRYELYNMDSFLQRLTPGRSVRYPALTLDGNQIFYVERDHEWRRLILADVAGKADFTAPHEILKVPFGGMLQYAAASSDGLAVAVLVRETETGNGTLTLCTRPDAVSRNFTCRALVSGDPVKAQMRFSSDNKSVLFSSDAGGVYNLYSVSVTDGKIRRLTRTLTGLFYPAPAPDGLYAVGFFKNGYDLVFLKEADLLHEDADALFAKTTDKPRTDTPASARIVSESDYGGFFDLHPYFTGFLPV